MVLPAADLPGRDGRGDGSRGWGIPMATDVAFALGALALLSRAGPLVARRVPAGRRGDRRHRRDPGGRVLLHRRAIALGWLAAGRRRPRRDRGAASGCRCGTSAVYMVARASLVWFAAFESGVHATIAGVALGLITPVRPVPAPAAVSGEAVRIARGHRRPPRGPRRRRRRVAAPGVALARGDLAADPRGARAAPVVELRGAADLRAGQRRHRARPRRRSTPPRETPVAAAVALGLVVGKTARPHGRGVRSPCASG